MRRSVILLSVIALALAWFAAGCSKGPSKLTGPTPSMPGKAPLISHTGASAVPDGWIVVFKSNVANVDGDVDEIETGRGFRSAQRYHSALKGFAAKLPAATVEALRSDPRVAYIEQDQIAHASVTQTGATWGLDRVDQVSLPLNSTYVYNQTGAGVDAYIIDTGINFTHTEFGGRAVKGIDEITTGGTAADANGHGTHVSGTVGGATYGVAKAVHLIAVRVLDATGSGTYAQVIAGVDWVTANHTTNPAVANMSLGGPVSTALDASVRAAIADGVVFCVAAGNSAVNASTSSPADVAEAITVGATDSADRWATFSNYGAGVDILAPGVNITSSWYTSNTATNTISGTSMASPHVAGAAALYLEANPGSTPAQVAAGLVAASSASKISGVPSGTVNKLLYSIAGPAGPPPPPPAAPTLATPANGATGIPASTTLTWNASATATAYGVQVARDAAFTTLVSNQSNLAGTSAAVSGLAANTTYYWRANASNAGGASAWSASASFTTAAGSPPAAPALSSPANGATSVSRTPAMRWTASTGATTYHMQVSTSSAFTTLTYDNAALTGTTVTLPQLGSRVTYYWRMSASNAYGTSAYSASRSFRTVR